MLYLAIDQHSKQLTVNLRNEQGDVVLRRQVSTRWAAVEAFFGKLAEDASREGGFMAILEVCGFNSWLVKLLEDPRYGCRKLVLIQPEKRGKRKTDRRDANELGEVLWVNRRRLLDGKRVQVRARVHSLPGYSAHADQANLLRFVRAIRRGPERVVLVHGEAAARRALGAEVGRLGITVR